MGQQAIGAEQFQSAGRAPLSDAQSADAIQGPLADQNTCLTQFSHVLAARFAGSDLIRAAFDAEHAAGRDDHQAPGIVQIAVQVELEPT